MAASLRAPSLTYFGGHYSCRFCREVEDLLAEAKDPCRKVASIDSRFLPLRFGINLAR
ncbi:hypothetical protein BDA96_08G111600 [Sorghum bicolor]|uniref:Uncharacterized protein n=1 Tax=Sorghum bicolor TaxID=4558 RepID=A0A921U7R5_SORBI|nr:hypothetical protein BDA96_08G111600 [Sorghum bicolor]